LWPKVGRLAKATGVSPAEVRKKLSDIDHHVGARLRERRIILGMTQQQLSDIQCTIRGIDMAGAQLWASTFSSSGSGSSFQFLTASINKSTIDTMHMACLVPGKQGSAVSVISTYRVVATP
jgi:hypothetical protein